VSPSSSGASAPSGGLPFTGADVAELSVIGVAALGAGTLLLRRGRHSHA
jgi:LPXTG-motif cell wall-anchored protein